MIRQQLGLALIWIGVTFDLLGALGLFRLPDVYNRLQAATKCVTFGTAGVLCGVFILKGFSSFGFKALFGIAFIFLTAPVAAHAIALAARRAGVPLAPESVIDQFPPTAESPKETPDAPAQAA